MDVAEPPRIMFESPARCADGHRAEELLRQVLARARAPGHAWVVTMRVDAATPGVLHGEGEITDDDGAAVGHRVFTGKPGDCGGLASAVGIWASLVLDAELKRPRTVAAAEEPPPATLEPGESPQPHASSPREAKPHPVVANADPQSAAEWQSGGPPGERPSRHEEGRTLELGAGGFLMTGTGGGLLVGATPFLLIEVAKGVFVRSAIALARSVPTSDPVTTWVATRWDGCLRVAGLYATLHGMQLDLCGGFDFGMLDTGRLLPYLAFGPSMDLRGELGGDLAVILRGLFGVNAVHEDSLDTPLWAGRGELAMSWRLR